MAFFDFLTGADEAAKASKKATREAINFAREGQEKASNALTQYLAPGANYGPAQSKLYDLSGLNGAQSQQNAFAQYQESPEVQFYRDQGLEAAQRSAAARGSLMSGRTLADLSDYNQNLAKTAYGDYYNRISGLYGSALNTAGALGGGLAGIYGNGGNTLANLAMTGGQQQAQYAGQQGGVLGDLLSQGIAGGAYIYGNRTGSSYGKP